MEKKKVLLAASVAGLLALTGIVTTAGTAYAEVNCVGANACAGKGACKGENNACAGKNACKGQGWVTAADDAACTGLGGTVAPAAPAAPEVQ